jgi:hypothetical protein
VAAGRMVTIEPRAARTTHPAVWLLRRQQFAAFPYRVFLGGPIASITPALKICLGQCRRVRLPGGIKIGTRQVEGLSRAVPIFPDLGSRVEAEDPGPLINVRLRRSSRAARTMQRRWAGSKSAVSK